MRLGFIGASLALVVLGCGGGGGGDSAGAGAEGESAGGAMAAGGDVAGAADAGSANAPQGGGGNYGSSEYEPVESVSSGRVTAAPGPPGFTPAGAMEAGGGSSYGGNTGGRQGGGVTHEVRMVGDGQGFRFEPSRLVISSGDRVRFTSVAGGPHNITFDANTLSPQAASLLNANMPEKMGSLASALKNNGEGTVISFAGLIPNRYSYFCGPHASLGMRGEIVVQ